MTCTLDDCQFCHTIEALIGINRVPFLPPRRPESPRQRASEQASALMSSVTRLARHSVSSFNTITPRPSVSQFQAHGLPLLSPGEAPQTPKQLPTIIENQVDQDSPDWAEWKKGEKRKLAARVISRTIVTAGCTTAAILIPNFERIMGFMGNFSAFAITSVLPVS